MVVLEYPAERGALPHILGGDRLYGVRNRQYGRTMLALYVYRPARAYDMKAHEFAGGDESGWRGGRRRDSSEDVDAQI